MRLRIWLSGWLVGAALGLAVGAVVAGDLWESAIALALSVAALAVDAGEGEARG